MNKKISKELESLLEFFPSLDPPITLSDDVTVSFSAKNKALPQELVDKYFSVWEQTDEFTEFIPCCRLEPNGTCYPIVYWKGTLMTYEFILLTLDAEANSISKKVIAGTISNGQSIKRSVATIDEDQCVYVVVGESDSQEKEYSAPNSKGFKFEILPDGKIESSQEETKLWEEAVSREAKN